MKRRFHNDTMPICPLDEVSSRGIPIRGIAGRFIRKANESN
jgi:hypothetical protein